MPGNSHVRFLGEGAAATPPPYPTHEAWVCMVISSRTPEGDPHRCSVCGKDTRTEPSTVPARDAPCPHCGSLLWFGRSQPSSPVSDRKRINRLVEEIARLGGLSLAPSAYYGGFLRLLLAALDAPAGALWGRTSQGNLELQARAGFHGPGLDQTDGGRDRHDELLRQALRRPALLVPPHGRAGPGDSGPVPAGNATGYTVLVAPYFRNAEVAGLLEVWQDPERSPEAQRGCLKFMVAMARHASAYAGKAAAIGVET